MRNRSGRRSDTAARVDVVGVVVRIHRPHDAMPVPVRAVPIRAMPIGAMPVRIEPRVIEPRVVVPVRPVPGPVVRIPQERIESEPYVEIGTHPRIEPPVETSVEIRVVIWRIIQIRTVTEHVHRQFPRKAGGCCKRVYLPYLVRACGVAVDSVLVYVRILPCHPA